MQDSKKSNGSADNGAVRINRAAGEADGVRGALAGDASGIVNAAPVGMSSYPTCDLCGERAATDELLARHRIRKCPGYVAPWRDWRAAA